MTQDDWKILLIGGGTGTGKTQLSLALGRRFDARVMEGDDLRWAIEAVVPRGADSDLHFFWDEDVWSRPLEDLLDRTLRLSSRMCQAAGAILARHHDIEDKLIIEAFWVLPEFASRSSFSGVDESCEVRSLFLYETDFTEVRERRARRSTSINEDARLSMFEAHGAWIREQAMLLGLPGLSSRPFETLEARAFEALSRP